MCYIYYCIIIYYNYIYCYMCISVIIIILKDIMDLGRGTEEHEWGEISGKDIDTVFMYEIPQTKIKFKNQQT